MSRAKDLLMRMEEDAATLPLKKWILKYPGRTDIYARVRKELREIEIC